MSTDDYRLCFVDDGCWAYFADTEPTDVWGDDWNDAPHDCNAGTPYANRPEGVAFAKVAFEADLWTVGVGAFGGHVHERWGWLSAQDIDAGRAPWLVQVAYTPEVAVAREIYAGITLGNFKLLVAEMGGSVYEAVPA